MKRTRQRRLGFEALESRSLLSASPLLGGNLLNAINIIPATVPILTSTLNTVANLGTGLTQALTTTLAPITNSLTPVLSPVVSAVTQTLDSVLGSTETVVAPILNLPIVTAPIGTLPVSTIPVVTLPTVTLPGLPTTPVVNTPSVPGSLPIPNANAPTVALPIVTSPAPASASTPLANNTTNVRAIPIQGVTPTITVPTPTAVTLPNGVAATVNLDETPTVQVPTAVIARANTAEPAFIVANAAEVDGFLVVPVDASAALAASSPTRSVSPSTEAEIIEASVTPFALLEQAMGEGIERLDQFVNSSLEAIVPGRDSYTTLSWLSALAVAGLVYEVARRDLERKQRAHLPLPVGTNLPESV